jgi:hypothetical protein
VVWPGPTRRELFVPVVEVDMDVGEDADEESDVDGDDVVDDVEGVEEDAAWVFCDN